MIHLHVHTMYSLRDSIIQYDDLINRLKEINQNAIAVTDHGNIHASVSLYKKLQKEKIKYIHGCEMYICDDVSIKDKDNKYYHLVVLCKNETGRLNLNKMISISNLKENFYNKPRIDFNILQQYKEGLIILSACLAGEISRNIVNGDIENAEFIATKYRSEFGNDFYLEVQARKEKTQIQVNQSIISIAKKLGIPTVVTTDAHYVYPEDKRYHDKYSFNSAYKEEGEGYVDCYIQDENEIRKNLDYIDSTVVDSLILNTKNIADKCNVDIPLSAPIIPHIDIPKQYSNEKEWLIEVCKDGFEKRGINYLPEDEKQIYYERYNYELNAISEMGFLGYYLMVYTYANKVQRRGIARGSGGGSLICYLMNITDIDPIEHKLYFERFIDVGALDALKEGKITRKELKVPDIDLDFGTHDREKIIQFLVSEYGQDKVACIGRFNYNQSKGTLKDIGRALDISFETVNEITKALGDYDLDDILTLIDTSNGKDKKPEIVIQFEKYIEQYPELFEISQKLIGLPSSFGLHPCGRIIAMQELDYYTASCYHESGERFLQGDMHDVEDLGLVKIDALGLRTIDVIYDTLDLIGKDYEYINPKKLDFTDNEILDIFKKGDTVGIFQFESYGMQSTLKDMKPSGIEDLSAANALYRPGAMAYIKNYCQRKHGEETVRYLHNDLIDILANTYGIMVFQEQLIEIGKLAKLKNPDKLRKATGKKDAKLLDEVKPELSEKLLKHGWSVDQFDQLWNDMLAFAKYSFNKSHSSAYAIIAYITAKLKVYHPLEFYISLMNSYIEDSSNYIKDKAKKIVDDASRHGVLLNNFSFRQDHRKCNINNNRVNYGIPLIKTCSQQNADELYQLRNDSYNNFVDMLYNLMNTTINASQLDALIKLGFFSEFGNARILNSIVEYFNLFKQGNAKQFDTNKAEKYPVICDIIKRNSRLTKSGKTYVDLNVKNILTEIEEWLNCNNVSDYTTQQKIDFQEDLLGFMHLSTGKDEDRRKLLVLEVKPLISQKNGKTWAYAIDEISIGSGVKNRLTIWSRVYEQNPIVINDIVYAERISKNNKGYWYLDSYKIIN